MKKYTVRDVVNMFDVTENTVVRWIDKNYINFELDNNNKIVFTEKHIEEFKETGKQKGYQVMK